MVYFYMCQQTHPDTNSLVLLLESIKHIVQYSDSREKQNKEKHKKNIVMGQLVKLNIPESEFHSWYIPNSLFSRTNRP